MPDLTRAYLDADGDSHLSGTRLTEPGLTGRIAHKGLPAPIRATRRWSVVRVDA